jgi:hypothetical protein
MKSCKHETCPELSGQGIVTAQQAELNRDRRHYALVLKVRHSFRYIPISLIEPMGCALSQRVNMQIDLLGYHPAEIVWSGVLAKIVEQTWEMGERKLILIHRHGRNRGITPGFVNTNTVFFGLQIRSALRHDKDLRRWIHHTTLDCSNPGLTSVSLKPNRSPIRKSLDL